MAANPSTQYRVSLWLAAECPRSTFWQLESDGQSEGPTYKFAQLCDSLQAHPHVVFSAIQIEGLDWVDDILPGYTISLKWKSLNVVENEEQFFPTEPVMGLAVLLNTNEVQENGPDTLGISIDAINLVYVRALSEICDTLGIDKVFKVHAQVELI